MTSRDVEEGCTSPGLRQLSSGQLGFSFSCILCSNLLFHCLHAHFQH